MLLNILVIHGYAQTAAIVAGNTVGLNNTLSDIATLNYVEGPAIPGTRPTASRPWWILDNMIDLEFDSTQSGRWNDSVKWWSDELSTTQYDGIIGLSQGSAMTGLLISMLNKPENAPGFSAKTQPIKFAILCSGFVSHKPPHGQIYTSPGNLPTLHTIDMHDPVVPPDRTIELRNLFNNSQLVQHNEGHAIPVTGDWPSRMKQFIAEACNITITDKAPTNSSTTGAAYFEVIGTSNLLVVFALFSTFMGFVGQHTFLVF